MSIQSQEQLLLEAQAQFDTLRQAVINHSQQHTRIDQVERSLFAQLLALGLTLLKAFVAKAGDGDEGEEISRGDHTLYRSEQPRLRWYRSIFGKLSICRWVYTRGAKKKIEYAATDVELALPAGEYSYVMEDWTQRLCVTTTFGEGVDGLAAVLGVRPSVETAEQMNARMAEHAEAFRLQQPAPRVCESAATTTDTILVAIADGTSVPMHLADRTTTPSESAGSRAGSTRRAYVGGVYAIDPFVREPQDVLDELFRDEATKRRPRPRDKRLWAEMASELDGNAMSGSDRVFIEMAIDVQSRDPDCQQTLVCLMDGEQKLWNLQREWLGRSIEILDFFHVLERVRDVSKVIYASGVSPAAANTDAADASQAAWVSAQVEDLLTGKTETVIRRWQRLSRESEREGHWTASQRDTVRSAIGYFSNNRHRMRYDEYLSHGYPIGSGMAEGACRNVVKDRLDCTGMHWRLPGARAMLKTRALYLNGEWDEFVEYRIQQEQETLYHAAA